MGDFHSVLVNDDQPCIFGAQGLQYHVDIFGFGFRWVEFGPRNPATSVEYALSEGRES